MFVVIPAYRPDVRLHSLIEGLNDEGVRFVIVDDGSGVSYASIFRSAEKDHDNVTVIRHSLNRGKGSALKTAFEYVSRMCRPGECILTIDADGERFTECAKGVVSAWREDPSRLVIGSRKYREKPPFKSRFITGVTRSVFAVTTGVRVNDILSGIRAFSADLIPELLKVKGDRYDFEIAELLYAAQHHIEIKEIAFETEYVPDSRSEHFRLFRDSWLIYKMIFVFMLSSFSCFVIDYSLLLILAGVFKSLRSAVETAPGEFGLPMFGRLVDTHLIALIIARTVSSFVNFLLNRKVVFKTGSKAAIVRFYVVIVGLLLANYGLLALVVRDNRLPLWIAQLVVQAVLYPFSFILQRKFVFPDRYKKTPAGLEKKEN
ncbi:MAG: bifunctional glycosyltransferase family 2/GtrA family protein [Clostridia bacterium]|nr:bifunctional glycosyltransferase family 2/GtrA family protein [Clostridia bacterium]